MLNAAMLSVGIIISIYKACSKKDRTFVIKTLLLILQHFKHCALQSSARCVQQQQRALCAGWRTI